MCGVCVWKRECVFLYDTSESGLEIGERGSEWERMRMSEKWRGGRERVQVREYVCCMCVRERYKKEGKSDW